MAGHLTRRETSRFSRETFRFSWNLSSFAETFRFSRSFSFSQKPFGFLPWLMAGHPLPINSQDHSSKRWMFFLRENPKIPERKNQELAGFLKPKIQKEKERSREKRKENSSLFDFRSKPGNLKCWDSYRNLSPTIHAPTRTPSGEIGPEDSWPRVLKDPIIACRKIVLQCKYRDSFFVFDYCEKYYLINMHNT